MTVLIYTDFSYAANLSQTSIEQQQEDAVRSLNAKCPHIIDDELEVHYLEPRPDPVLPIIRQRVQVECDNCGMDYVFHM